MNCCEVKRETTPTYEEVLRMWSETTPHKDVFSGHFLISFVTNTNQIENIPVDYNTTRELFRSEQITNYTGELRDIFSVLNNRNVAAYMNECVTRNAPLSKELILHVHRLLMFGSIDRHRYEDNGERAGCFKKHDYCVGQLSVGSTPDEVEGDVEELCSTCRFNAGKDPCRLAAVFQCEFEYIHPFADGNGRTGRWLTNYLLVKGGHPPIVFTRDKRQKYYDALEEFDKTGEYTAMYDYLKEQTEISFRAMREII